MTAPRPDQRVVLVAAHARNRVIGDGGAIPWHLPHDFAHFKRETLGHTLVMGRRTWDSIGRPLPGRATIVVTRDESFDPGFEGVQVAHSLEEAFALAAELSGDVMIAGGGEIYALALPFATHQVLTEVDLSPPGDAFYPEYPVDEWVEVRREVGEGCQWTWLERMDAAA
ncbi:dihydrofolate reductase [Nocardioides glacieisoli]|uniref:Dihydrofolate reductase n=1 Tax=Nocardioides glacieisoli TaxID=1168730 RepID=A0A4Q2RL41_9ACTN|nr:dihydrofolate reductase [Nocardioides glacieisoli]RYB89036.1 dihydrofolate reductase [Nocardioides glacieisoli]